MSDPEIEKDNSLHKPDAVLIKGVQIGGQAEKLVRARREITRSQEMTRIEKLENEAREKIEKLLDQARNEAGRILEQAKQEAVRIKTKARMEGDLAAKREALDKLENLISSLETEVEGIKKARRSFLENNLAGIINFSCDLAKKIMVCEIQTHPEIIARRARMLIERMPSGADITLAVNPQDLGTIETYLRETGSASSHILTLLKSDPGLQAGSLRLESDSGRIDAGFIDALEQIGSLLQEQALNQQIAQCGMGEGKNDG